MRLRIVVSLVATTLLAFSSLSWAEENRAAWRTPDGNGVFESKNLPETWSETQGILWKTPIPAWGASTPAVWGDAIFLTSHVEPVEEDAEGPFDLVALRIDRNTGRIVWQKKLGEADIPRTGARGRSKYHRYHNAASPSPTTDGRYVVFHFGNGDLVVTDFDGNTVWRRNLQDDYAPYSIWWGHANSPIIVGDLLISICIQDSLADLQEKPNPSYIVAHELATGRERWFTLRMTGAEKEWCDAYTTPIVRRVDGRTEIIVMGGTWLDAYDAQSGKQLWYLPGLEGNRTITGPVVVGDVVFATIGKGGPTFAARIGGEGRLPRDRILWENKSNCPDSPTPVYYRGLLFLVSDNGIAQCLDAATGEIKWRERIGGTFKASPIVADGKVYFVNLEGECTVTAADAEYREIAKNELDDAFTASPVCTDGRLYLRGKRFLYCIGKP